MRTLYKAYGASLAWEIEIRWKELGGYGHVAEIMLFEIGGTADITSYKKQFGRWKAWSSGESSFASADEGMLKAILGWCLEQTVLSRKVCAEIERAMVAMLRYIHGTSTPADLHLSLERGIVSLKSLTRVDRVVGTRTMFLDAQENEKFRRKQLPGMAPNGVRLDKRAKRWKEVEATVVAIETAEEIGQQLAHARNESKTWELPSKDLTKLKVIANRVAEHISVALNNTALSEQERGQKADEIFAILSDQMKMRFKKLQSSPRSAH